jgi:hypothetical protein
MRISKEYKEKWITALTSGKYSQTEGELYDGRGNYCAIGVALHACSNIPKKELEGCSQSYELTKDYSEKIPYELHEGEVINDEIMELNDDELYSFESIADWINMNVETA